MPHIPFVRIALPTLIALILMGCSGETNVSGTGGAGVSVPGGTSVPGGINESCTDPNCQSPSQGGSSGTNSPTPPPVSSSCPHGTTLENVNMSLLVLDPSANGALTLSGSSQLSTSSAVVVDSKSSQGVTLTGAAKATAAAFFIVGGDSSPQGSLVATTPNGIHLHDAPVSDPLASLPQPDPTKLTVQSQSPVNVSSNSVVNLQPGVFNGGIAVSGSGKVNLAPGIYYIAGGGLSVSGNGSLIGNQVMIFLGSGPNFGGMSITGNGSLKLSPPTTGPYLGITVFVERSCSPDVNLTGSAQVQVLGMFYAPKANVSINGNAYGNMGSQYICNTLTLTGNGTLNLGVSSATPPPMGCIAGP
jgi:hypothetical protein